MSQAKAYKHQSNTVCNTSNRERATKFTEQLMSDLKSAPVNNQTSDKHFNGAAIIDEHGNEIPITEDMIQKACAELTDAWIFPRNPNQ